MRGFVKKIPTAALILLILGVFFLIWGTYQNIPGGNKSSVLNAPLITKNDLTADTSGGVIVSGTPEILSKPTDPLTGVTADGLVLVRTVEMYQYVIENDEIFMQFSEKQEENIKGRNGEKYTNPSFPEELRSAVFTGKAAINGVTLGDGCYFALTEDIGCFDTENIFIRYTDLKEYKNDMELLPREDGTYSNSVKGERNVGDIRVSYTYLPVNADDVYTFFGNINGGILGDKDGVFVFGGELTAEEIYEKAFAEHDNTSSGLYLFGAAALVIAAVLTAVSVKNNKKREDETA